MAFLRLSLGKQSQSLWSEKVRPADPAKNTTVMKVLEKLMYGDTFEELHLFTLRRGWLEEFKSQPSKTTKVLMENKLPSLYKDAWCQDMMQQA